jgi:hypothetical protein
MNLKKSQSWKVTMRLKTPGMHVVATLCHFACLTKKMFYGTNFSTRTAELFHICHERRDPIIFFIGMSKPCCKANGGSTDRSNPPG